MVSKVVLVRKNLGWVDFALVDSKDSTNSKQKRVLVKTLIGDFVAY